MKKILALVCICVFLIGAVPDTAYEKHNYLFPSENNIELSATDSYDLLIIAPDDWKEDIARFVQHKEDHGIRTILVGTNEIYSGSYFDAEGRDDAEKVKYFIKNALDEWNITFVLLVGGRMPGIEERWYVPVRYVEVELFGETTYLSDLYFADIYDDAKTFQSWDENGDSVFGTKEDGMDLHPDVAVGRWACRNRQELKTVIEKTIAYETTPETEKKIVLVGGDTWKDHHNDMEGELVTEKTASYMKDYEKIRVYASEEKVNALSIIQALGDGASFMHLFGHGWVIYWNTYQFEAFEGRAGGFGIWHMPLFSNSHYPIVMLDGCHTAMFNVCLTYRPYTWMANAGLPLLCRFFPGFKDIAWALTSAPHGGSVATLGYTCFTAGAIGHGGDFDGDGVDEPNCVEYGCGYMDTRFFYAHGVEGKSYLGECWSRAEDIYIDTFNCLNNEAHLRTVESIVILGDPSIKIGGYQ